MSCPQRSTRARIWFINFRPLDVLPKKGSTRGCFHLVGKLMKPSTQVYFRPLDVLLKRIHQRSLLLSRKKLMKHLHQFIFWPLDVLLARIHQRLLPFTRKINNFRPVDVLPTWVHAFIINFLVFGWLARMSPSLAALVNNFSAFGWLAA